MKIKLTIELDLSPLNLSGEEADDAHINAYLEGHLRAIKLETLNARTIILSSKHFQPEVKTAMLKSVEKDLAIAKQFLEFSFERTD
ncbi:MAG: hypothetical protein OEY01_03505 [Desulfobulbaceae bacterium]|nr:hypothetical protein [Desulfobulbaceae bacterium]